MGTARRVLDWHKQNTAELARQLEDLPEGRYVLVPENELEADRDDDLSPEDEAAIEEGLDAIDRGETVAWEQVRAEMDAMIAAARTGRSR
jgi:predicted transcriptional regulator